MRTHQSRLISPLFTSTRAPSKNTITTSTSNRNSLLTLITSLQNITLEIQATSHLFTTTVPLSSTSTILPTYLSGVISALETLPQRKETGLLRRDMRVKVVIVHGLRETNPGGRRDLYDSNNRSDETDERDVGGESSVEEVEYLFFGTKEAVLERFPLYLSAVLRVEEDPLAVERINDVLLEVAEKDV